MKTIKGFVKKYWVTALIFVGLVFLVVYNIVWATLFATITGIMTIDKRYLDLLLWQGL